jgi:UDP-glucose 4-epimerase
MILVTGGFGFIGSQTVRALLDAGEDCVVPTRRVVDVPDILRSDLGGRLFVERVDLTDGDQVMDMGRRHSITGIVHLADPAVAQVVGSILGGPPARFSQLLVGLGNVLDAAIEWGVGRATIASTVGVYAGTGNGPWPEDRPLPLASLHGIPAMKKIAETLGSFAAAQYGLPAVFIRPSFIWGPGGRSESFISPLPALVHAAARGDAQFSSEGREYFADDAADICYVKDCAKAIALIQLAPVLDHDVYNIGGGNATSNVELVKSIRRSVPDFTAQLSAGSSPDQPESAFLDLTHLQADTGYQPDYSRDSGMVEYINWLRAGHER